MNHINSNKRLLLSEAGKQIVSNFEGEILNSWEIQYDDDYDEYGPKQSYWELHVITSDSKELIYLRMENYICGTYEKNFELVQVKNTFN